MIRCGVQDLCRRLRTVARSGGVPQIGDRRSCGSGERGDWATPRLLAYILLVLGQCVGGVQTRGLARWVKTGNHGDEHGHYNRDEDGHAGLRVPDCHSGAESVADFGCLLLSG